jgi:zinc protease
MSESDFEATRSFLAKSVSLLTDGQSRQLGYGLDSGFYEIENFADYVRDGLSALTLDSVNRVIRENLRTDNLQYVFVAVDAQDLRDRLTSNRVSSVTYDAAKSESLLIEDREIEALSLGLNEDAVRIVRSEKVFN